MPTTSGRSAFLAEAQALLLPGEANVPEAVIKSIHLLHDAGVWFQLSRNHDARSCRDAAHKRRRLGKEGIPLWDEMRTFLGRYHLTPNDKRFVLAHTRADRPLDLGRLARALGAVGAIERVALEEFSLREKDLAYGLINPFTRSTPVDATKASSDASPGSYTQVFDEDTTMPLGLPGTMMTNAGEFTWSVEFRPEDLAPQLADTLVAPISENDPEAKRLPALTESRPIGILTGNGPDTGIIFWNKMNEHIRLLLGDRASGDVSMPRVFTHSVPEMGLSMELDRRRNEVWSAIRETVEQLMQAGARFIVVPDNTTPYFTNDIRALCNPRGVEFLSQPEATGLWLKENGFKNIALVGIRYVADLDGPWSAYKQPLDEIEVETVPDHVFDQIQEIAYRVKNEGMSSNYGLNRLRDILRQHVKADAVVLALTELSILLDRAKGAGKGKTLIDPLAIYAEAVAKRYLDLPFP